MLAVIAKTVLAGVFVKFSTHFGVATVAATIVLSTTAMAADVATDQQNIGYRIGVAFAGVHNTLGGLGILPSGGVKFEDTRASAMFDGAFAYDFAPNWGVQGDLQATAFGRPEIRDRDWTNTYGHGAVHLYHRTDNFLVGGFGGLGAHNDMGDSHRGMNYWFAGVEGKLWTGWGSFFGQAGIVDPHDEYDDGARDVPFARIGANYFIDDNWSVKADGAYGTGRKWGILANRVLDFNVESEIRPDSWPVSVFGRYEFTQLSYHPLDNDSVRFGENFHTFMVGLRFRSGSTLREADSAPGSLDLPSLGKWAAFNANEI